MKKGIFLFVLVAGFAQFTCDDAAAQFVKAVKEPLAKSPGGGRTGELYRNTPVKILEERGQWAKVQVTGWMVRDSLGAEKKGAANADLSSGVLKVSGYEIKHVKPIKNASDQTARVFLRLKVKNSAKKPILSWQGLLIVKSQAGTILFREPISDSAKAIFPGAESESVFSWNDGEEQYIALLSQAPNSFDISIGRLKVEF